MDGGVDMKRCSIMNYEKGVRIMIKKVTMCIATRLGTMTTKLKQVYKSLTGVRVRVVRVDWHRDGELISSSFFMQRRSNLWSPWDTLNEHDISTPREAEEFIETHLRIVTHKPKFKKTISYTCCSVD